jgi:hypothetical protein
MAVDDSALSEPLEMSWSGDGLGLIRESVRLVLQELIEAEAAEFIGARRYDRTESPSGRVKLSATAAEASNGWPCSSHSASTITSGSTRGQWLTIARTRYSHTDAGQGTSCLSCEGFRLEARPVPPQNSSSQVSFSLAAVTIGPLLIRANGKSRREAEHVIQVMSRILGASNKSRTPIMRQHSRPTSSPIDMRPGHDHAGLPSPSNLRKVAGARSPLFRLCT